MMIKVDISTWTSLLLKRRTKVIMNHLLRLKLSPKHVSRSPKQKRACCSNHFRSSFVGAVLPQSKYLLLRPKYLTSRWKWRCKSCARICRRRLYGGIPDQRSIEPKSTNPATLSFPCSGFDGTLGYNPTDCFRNK